tara:strand:+ start:694 stop:1506 length:813 start_codon:yes stop_codon:yes gene_type:complete
METEMNMEPVITLSRDIAAASATLGRDEARFLVDAYYQMQENRIRAQGQIRAMSESGEPHQVLAWLFEQNQTLENQIKRALAKYIEAHEMGPWLLATKGIGPVIAAGLVAHIDMDRASSPSAIWRFAGLDPTAEWKKGMKRPHNADLKTLCWKIGESFVKVSGYDDAHYGRLWAQKKAELTAKNEAGEYAETAARILEEKRIGKATDAYKHLTAGKLPPGQIHARAKRWAVKVFLAHMWEAWYETRTGKPAPDPWIIAHGGHVDRIKRFH